MVLKKRKALRVLASMIFDQSVSLGSGVRAQITGKTGATAHRRVKLIRQIAETFDVHSATIYRLAEVTA
jgi:hypothetical protein